MSVQVRIPIPLRAHTGGAGVVTVSGGTVGAAVEALAARFGGIGDRLIAKDGGLRSVVNLFVGADNVGDPEGMCTVLQDGDVLTVVPAVFGAADTKAKERRLAALRAAIPQVTPAEALAMQQQGAQIIDVRERDEIAQGSPVGARRLGRGYLELKIEEVAPDLDQPLLTLCSGGTRSLFAAEDLVRMGYTSIYSISGGFSRWKSDGLAFELPPMLDTTARERYARHLMMPEVGEAGQLKLLDSKVLLVGAGGLGCPAAFYLAAAGVGTLGLIDHDVVDRSNLQRQILHTDDRIGQSKVASARMALQALNPGIVVQEHAVRLTSGNVEALFNGFDVIVDGSDNFATRYLINDACVRLGLPNVHGAVFRFEGQVSVFWPKYANQAGPCYRCLYPEPPPPELAPSCAEAGVLGVLPGVIGVVQAVETIKLLLGIGDPLIGRMLYYEALAGRFSELRFKRNPDCAYCGEQAEFPGYVDYQEFCAAG